MRYFIYYYFLTRIIGNPIISLGILIIAFILVERKFIGIIPDIFKPLKRKRKIANLKSTIKLNPANINAYRELGSLYLEDNKYQKAEENFMKTLDKMDNYAETHFLLGKAYYLQNKIDLGITELETAIDINPKIGYGEPYIYLLAEAYSSKKNENNINDYIGNLHYYGTVETLYKAGEVISKYDQKKAKEMFKKALEIYNGGPKYLKRLYRRWAILARIKG
ncbi:Tetratricopeptide repeat-containing protein [Desulfonispora thiosulfatigenes DSM 11270]|uniref:Tetratricopeptide repeat-containing protein n=1 Tax=Desulfonispora thiosulfatigenes DSM 11270 TaxID=656914 RepID=A0A1W1VS92_DESTI|nr:hypothetical protein [Desulfonispora thiosulfatigenes]SMB96218.1 Tetratricopeptide repeat-containing protein [Desulfonispora thiosulfatigenes DSM 11270]